MQGDRRNSRTLLTAICIIFSLDKKRKQAIVSPHCQVLTFYLDGLETVSKLKIECVRVADLLDCCVAI